MEEVDIVDKNDEVIGQESKENAHKKGLLHKLYLLEFAILRKRF